MRLDKYLSETGTASRSESARAAKAGLITVNGDTVRKSDIKINEDTDTVTYRGITVIYRRFTYIMLNKPAGYISATEDGREKTVLELLAPEYIKMKLFPCGRLDKDTVGLLLMTNDGDTAYRLLSPKHHVTKKYNFRLAAPISDSDCEKLAAGIDIGDCVTKPASIELSDSRTSGSISITEGKFHQIKRMFEAVENKIIFLERAEFGPLILDPGLARGEWRLLNENEIKSITQEEQK